MPAAADYIDPVALMRVKSLEMRAKMVMEGFWRGIHRSPYHGFSVEFSEYRQYTKGDDPRFIDWKVMARTDRAYIKKFEDETNLRAHLIVDRSKSMTYGSGEYSKSDYVATFATTLGFFLMGQGDAVGLTTFDQKLDLHIPARNRPGHLRRLMIELEKAPGGVGTDLAAGLRGINERVRKRSLLVMFSDFLAPLEEVEREIGHLAAAGHDVTVVQCLDPAEREFTFDKAVHFEDAETGRELYVDPATAKKQYLARLQTHLDGIRKACTKVGGNYHLFSTDYPLEMALAEFVQRR
ncbi:MAG: DUF58 domain-containing protein [Verrucomicrobiales bacterium]|nr:DUF58 domain-containing protein [Verrucomicrobiales bacterium]